MLLRLTIRDIVLIDTLDLTFQPGLCVLTGETGAGKSILLDALGLALGMRASPTLLRPGAARASVSAVFALPEGHPARALLAESDLAAEDEVILRRVVSADGRSRGYVDDQPISIGLMRGLGRMLVEIQGQSEQHGLLDPATHRGLLDTHAGLTPRVDAVATAWRDWRRAADALAAGRAALDDATAQETFLRHALGELEALDPQPGEEAILAADRAMMMHREQLVEALNAAREAATRPRPVEDALGAARAHLDRIAGRAGGRLDPVIAAFERATLETAEAMALLTAAGEAIDLDGNRLDGVEERLFALRELARKHGTEVDALPALRDEIADRLAALDDQSGAIARLADAVADARATYVGAARRLSEARAAAAATLDAAMAAELPPLKLEKAVFRTRVELLDEADWGPAGIDRVSFEVATNPGAPPGPIGRIASGGELARFMLALKVVLSRAGDAPTLIFDEVDSGIGGATAHAVGERLARLGDALQVLVVTHSPQVAARGDHHWRVVKTDSAEAAITAVDEIAGDARREEIARMLSGRDVTDEARAAADRLLAGTTS